MPVTTDQIKGQIDSNLPDATDRRNKASIVRALLKLVVDWVRDTVNGNLPTWYKVGTTSPAGLNADNVYRTGKTIIGRNTDDGSGAKLQVEGAATISENLGVVKNVSSRSLLLSGGIPTVAVQSSLGTGGSVSLVAGSSDSAGQISITTGSNPGNSGYARITFSQVFATTPKIALLTPSSQSASVEYSKFVLFVDGNSSITLFGSNGGNPAPNTIYRFNYLIIL